MKTPAQIAAMREMDRDILHYVRESQQLAPVTVEAVHSYLVHMRRRNADLADVVDRMDDLVDEGKLKGETEWVAGQGNVKFYSITAKGRDVLDGVIEG